jgi:hypothetical protein
LILAALGTASLGGGFWLLLDSVDHSGRRRHGFRGITLQSADGTAAAFFAVVGAALIVTAAMMMTGPWRDHYPAPVPIHLRSLDIPPAAIERVAPR